VRESGAFLDLRASPHLEPAAAADAAGDITCGPSRSSIKAGMCRVLAAMKSLGVKTSKSRWIFGSLSSLCAGGVRA